MLVNTEITTKYPVRNMYNILLIGHCLAKIHEHVLILHLVYKYY